LNGAISILRCDSEHALRPAIDGERNLLRRELAAGVALHRWQRGKWNPADLHERAITPAPHGDVGGDTRAGA